MYVPALEIAYQEETIYVYDGIRRLEEGESAEVKRLKQRYRRIVPQKDAVLASCSEEWKSFSFLYPLLKPLFVSDLARKKKLTQREQQALMEKARYAGLLGVHPDRIIVHTAWEAY